MHRGITGALIFTLGAAVGSLVTWKILDNHFTQLLKEEEAAIREYYRGCEKEEEAEAEPKTDIHEEEKTEEAKQLLLDLEYTNEENIEKEDKLMDPYVISPEEFGELDDYDTDSLTYYEDGVLTNDMDEPIDNIDDIVGKESLERFGEYEDDSVFVRNDRLKCDYEILKDYRKYSEVTRRPYTPEEE